ncbi:MAG: GntR family transcriptional regulator, partial [Deltaproteobacteria bacterium]|nr:GntR family transcriptional regulator [Deltaproteobacteria bacterium]
MSDLSKLPDLDKNDYKPLYIQLCDTLTEYIQTNGLAPGDLLPSENDLLDRYGISRTTIRQAFQRLEAQETVIKVRGKGTFVAAPKHREHVRGFQDLEEGLAEQGFPVTNVLLEISDIHLSKVWAEHLTLPAGSQARSIRRLQMTGDKPLALEERLLPPEVANRFVDEDFKEGPIFDLLSRYPETEIMRVTYRITSSPLRDQEVQEMGVAPDSAVIRRTGIYFDHQERPVMVGKVTFLADRIELRFEFHKKDDNWGIVA